MGEGTRLMDLVGVERCGLGVMQAQEDLGVGADGMGCWWVVMVIEPFICFI
jgi:hypothetical protein